MTSLSPELAPPADVQTWLAAERVATDYITPIMVDRFRTLLGRSLTPSKNGDPAPLGLHWALGPDGLDPASLGADGRPRGTPGVPVFPSLPSEMWAGAETTFARQVGADAIASVKFRAEGPAYGGARLVLRGLRHAREVQLLAQTDTGTRIMSATVTLRG